MHAREHFLHDVVDVRGPHARRHERAQARVEVATQAPTARLEHAEAPGLQHERPHRDEPRRGLRKLVGELLRLLAAPGRFQQVERVAVEHEVDRAAECGKSSCRPPGAHFDVAERDHEAIRVTRWRGPDAHGRIVAALPPVRIHPAGPREHFENGGHLQDGRRLRRPSKPSPLCRARHGWSPGPRRCRSTLAPQV
jgi:hypothetical protein